MAYSYGLTDRMLAHQFASTSSRNAIDVKPARFVPRQRRPMRTYATATVSPSKPTASSAVAQARASGSSPGRVFLSSTRAAAGQLWGVLKFFQAEEEAALSPEIDNNVLQETAKRAKEADEVQEKVKAKKQKQPPADISKYLRPVGILETRYARLMASLCAQTYDMERLSKERLWRKHRLHLVTTSSVFQRIETVKSAQQTLDEGDGMVSSTKAVEIAQSEVTNPTQAQQPASLATFPELPSDRPKGFSPTDLVNQGLAAAAAAAANAAAPFAYIGNAVPFRAVTSRMQSAAAAGQSTAVATIATVTAAVSSNFNKEHSKGPKGLQAADPSEWFVCDDPVSHTRYFVIQGSQTIDHWRLNLSFDPVVFEDAALGIKVHRGVYNAAEILYQRYFPMVEEQLASSPFAKVAFTGHSLGGSLGTLLMMMYKHRGVLPQSAIAPVYTFGAPAIFCEGGCSQAASCSLPAPKEAAIVAASNRINSSGPATSATEPTTDIQGHVKDQGALQALDLEAGLVRNIFMNKDIVPRAFACDYTLVADLLRRVSDGFREHNSLKCPQPDGRVVMYFFIGKMMILQPDRDHDFVMRNEMYHDMLPARPGLWVLRQPQADTPRARKHPSSTAQIANGHASDARHAAGKTGRQSASALQHHGKADASQSFQGQGSSSKLTAAVKHPVASMTISGEEGRPAASLKEAVMDLMNYPHPLDTLGEPSAYGPDGAISRYHNPDHYCQAIGGVLRTKTKPRRVNITTPRWYLDLQEKEHAMKHKVRNMRNVQVERTSKRQQQLHLQKQHHQKKLQSPPSVINEWRHASQHHG